MGIKSVVEEGSEEVETDSSISDYILGIIESEGSFSMSVIVADQYSHNIHLGCSFSMRLHERDMRVAQQVKSDLGMGTICVGKDGMAGYQIQSSEECMEFCIMVDNTISGGHMFTESHKHSNFKKWRKAVEIKTSTGPDTKEDKNEFLDIRESLVTDNARCKSAIIEEAGW